MSAAVSIPGLYPSTVWNSTPCWILIVALERSAAIVKSVASQGKWLSSGARRNSVSPTPVFFSPSQHWFAPRPFSLPMVVPPIAITAVPAGVEVSGAVIRSSSAAAAGAAACAVAVATTRTSFSTVMVSPFTVSTTFSTIVSPFTSTSFITSTSLMTSTVSVPPQAITAVMATIRRSPTVNLILFIFNK